MISETLEVVPKAPKGWACLNPKRPTAHYSVDWSGGLLCHGNKDRTAARGHSFLQQITRWGCREKEGHRGRGDAEKEATPAGQTGQGVNDGGGIDN